MLKEWSVSLYFCIIIYWVNVYYLLSVCKLIILIFHIFLLFSWQKFWKKKNILTMTILQLIQDILVMIEKTSDTKWNYWLILNFHQINQLKSNNGKQQLTKDFYLMYDFIFCFVLFSIHCLLIPIVPYMY